MEEEYANRQAKSTKKKDSLHNCSYEKGQDLISGGNAVNFFKNSEQAIQAVLNKGEKRDKE